jgi:predicted HicB family RNase H-like nuclease
MSTSRRPVRQRRARDLQEALDAARRGPAVALEESNRHADISEEEWAAAHAELDRLEREGEVHVAPLAAPAGRRPTGRRPTAASGRFLVRVPRTVHVDLVSRAAEEGVSVNQLVASYIARGLGEDAPRPRTLRAQ